MADIVTVANAEGSNDGQAEIAASVPNFRHAKMKHFTMNPNTPLRSRFQPSSAVTLACLDLLLMTSCIAGMMFAIRQRLDFDNLSSTMSAVACIVLTAIVLCYATGCYRQDSMVDFSVATTRLATALGATILLIIPIFQFGLTLEFHSLAIRSISRNLTLALIGVGAGLCGGMLSRVLFLAMARRQWFRRNILVIGTGQRACHLRSILERTDRRLTQVHFLTEAYLGGDPLSHLPGNQIDCGPDRMSAEELAAHWKVDQVVIAVDEPHNLYFHHLLPWKAAGIPVFDFNSFLERETGRVDLNWTEPDWLLYSDGFHFSYLDRAIKRLMDIGISVCLLFVVFPALLIISAAIVIDDFGPVIYRQVRIGYRGRKFWILKFRTMRVDAERNGAQWANENDPRVTRLGTVLRRTRVDELPQLINVMRGEMSLVGPRPERPVFVDGLAERLKLYHLRHSVKAGLTGWAQINYHYGASVDDAERKLEYDLYYLKHFSVMRDIAIMLQTFRILIFAKGGR